MTQAILALAALAAAFSYLARRLLRKPTAKKRSSCCGCSGGKPRGESS